MNKVFGHFKTITTHKLVVMKECFKIGLYKQGLLHDLSKYGPVEFLEGCKFYTGTQSPHHKERASKGYSEAWLHHKGRNKHHFEYWIDYSMDSGKGLEGTKMPPNYVAEMMMDRIAAAKVYNKGSYNDHQPLDYYERGKHAYMIHPETRALLEFLLHMLDEQGEEVMFDYIRKNLVGKKDYPKFDEVH